jgi:TRAP-type mannitol/chloroaromatic compound transport system permease small subunit
MSMIARLLSGIGWLSRILGGVTMAMTAILIVVMSYEMVVRRGFDAPTLWAFDVSYMLSGVIFVAAVPFALLRNEHVRIDFLSTRLPLRVQHAANLFFYAALFLPAIFILARVAVGEAWTAFVTGQTERVSPWAPLIWPYYSALAVGLVALVLQVLAEMVRHAMQIVSPTAPVGAQAAPSVAAPVIAAKPIDAPMPADMAALAAEKS